MRCSVHNRVLEVRDPDDGRLLWRGTFEGGAVRDAVPLPGTEDCIVVLETDVPGALSDGNVMRVRPNGTIVWRPLPVPGVGAYFRLEIRYGYLMAWSWTGYMVRLNPKRGSIVEKTFVK